MISIIVPVYNSEATIGNCLSSILCQDFYDLEIIVVNDGSKDKSQQILEYYQEKDSRVKVYNQNNSGVSCARNKGLNMAQGEYIMFVDSDDTIQPNTCSRVISFMTGEVDMVIFGLNIYRGNKLLRTPHLGMDIFNLRENIDLYWCLRKINLGPCNKLYKRKIIKKFFDTSLSLGEDTLFVIDYMKNVRMIKSIEDCLYNVSLDNSNSLNRVYRVDRLDPLIFVRNKEVAALAEMYHGNSDSRIYEEYFFDLHVILTGLFYYNIDNKLVSIKHNLQKFDYTSIYTKTQFSSLYYRLFSVLVSNQYCFLLYVLLRVRILIEKILLRK